MEGEGLEESRMAALKKLLYPKSIAVIGASNQKNKSGGRLMEYLTKHKGPHSIYPVNPKEDRVYGRPCYRSIEHLPEKIDLALVVLPGKMILKIVEECAAKGINVLAVYGSGFAEMGEEGVLLQRKLVDKAKELGVYICGPNMIGIVNANQRFFGSFSMAMETPDIPQSGSIAFVSQSGAIGGGILSKLWSEGIGISFFVSSGNEADLETADYLSFLAEDQQTEIICVYLEGVKDGKKFIDSLKKARKHRKPVIIYKNGRTSIGQKSVQSHTGSLAGNYQVYETVFKQYGAIYVDVLEDMFEVAKGFLSLKNLPGRNVAVISTSGGACTIIADNCLHHGLRLPDFSESTKEDLLQVIPDFGAVQNPFDTTASIINNPENLKKALEIVLNDPNIDSIMLMLTTVGDPIASMVAKDIIELTRKSEKSIILSWLISETLASNAFALLRKSQIPIFSSPEKAVLVLKKIAEYYESRSGVVLE